MLRDTLRILGKKEHVIYTQPYRLNIVATRSRSLRSNRFDDRLEVFFVNSRGKWEHHAFPCTTDPGQYWLDNPMHPNGTAFLKNGQYIDAYGMGWHRGRYEALVQIAPVTVIRNYDRSGLFNWTESGFEDRGNFGINIHRAFGVGTAVTVDRSSAGCIVLADTKDYDRFICLCKKHRRTHGNSFAVTLIDFRDIRRRDASLVAWGLASGLTLGALAYYIYETDKKFKKRRIGIDRLPIGAYGRQMVQT